MVVKKAYSLGKLLQNHHAFKDDIVELNKRIMEKKKIVRDLEKEKRTVKPKVAAAHREEKKISHDAPSISVKTDELVSPLEAVKSLATVEDDLESYDSNPALFSDEEEEAKKNPIALAEAILR